MHACLPWDAPDSELMDVKRERDYKASDSRYSQRKICCHPDCSEWIRNDAMTCKSHRDWYYEISHGEDTESILRRHRQIKALVAQGTPVLDAIRIIGEQSE